MTICDKSAFVTLVENSSKILKGLKAICLVIERKILHVKGSIPSIVRVNLVQLSVMLSSPYALETWVSDSL